MKNRILLAFAMLLVLSIGAPGQTPRPQDNSDEPHITNYQRFVSRPGALIIKEYFKMGSTIGKGGAITIYALVSSNPSKTEQNYSVVVEHTKPGANEGDEVGILDFDESMGFLNAMDYVINHAHTFKGQTEPFTRIVYHSRDWVETGLESTGDQQSAYVDLNRDTAETRVYFSLEKFSQLREFLARSRDKLEAQGSDSKVAR